MLKSLVELDVDLGAVCEGDLDLVVALLVADLGLGDLAAAGVGQGRRDARWSAGTGDRRWVSSSSPPAVATATPAPAVAMMPNAAEATMILVRRCTGGSFVELTDSDTSVDARAS